MRKVQDAKGGNKFDSLRKRKANNKKMETEDEQDGNNTESDVESNTKPPVLRIPRFSKQVATKKISKIAGHV